MNIVIEKFKGCYTIETHCDDCNSRIEPGKNNGVKFGGYWIKSLHACKKCKKTLCIDCIYGFDKGEVFKTSGYFPTYCLICAYSESDKINIL